MYVRKARLRLAGHVNRMDDIVDYQRKFCLVGNPVKKWYGMG